MYLKDDSPLFHRFTNDHKVQFSLQINLLLKSGARSSSTETFLTVLDSDSLIWNDDETNSFIIDPYHHSANKGATFDMYPEKGKFLPSRGEKQSPKYIEWK